MARLSFSLYLSALITLLFTSTLATPIHLNHHNGSIPTNCTAQSIVFSTCAPELNFPPSLQCANFSVPINWDEPNGEHFDLGLVKLAAPSNSTNKIGSLFINPGGPGAPASQLVAQVAGGALQSPLSDTFDWIGLDPRGVGLSKQVECDMDIYAERVSLFPKTQEEYDELVDKNRRLGESCRKLTGPLLEHIDTISVAKDHEAVRIALDNEPFNMVGLSYGTQIGAQYAQLFPDNIRTLVLDGVLQHSQGESTNLLIESLTYSLVLSHFFVWAASNETSVLKGKDVEALWISLTNATNATIPAPSCNGTDCNTDVTAEEILSNAQQYLTVKDPGFGSSWATLSSALYNATQGDASALSTRFDDQVAVSERAIGCLDWTHTSSLSLAGVQAKKHMVETFAPLTQGATQTWALQHSCLGWPVDVKNPPKKLDVDTEATILMVNSDADPSTSYAWATGMLEEIRNKVLVTRKGDGHTSLILGGESAEVIVEYLITGVAPKDGLVTTS